MVANQFYPRYAQINAITNAQNAVVTFTDDHDFIIGEFVSFRVTPDFGMFQINNKKGKVLFTTDTQVTVNIDSTTWDAFDYSLIDTAGTSPPVCVPCCSGVVSGDIPYVVIDDAFDNRRV